MTEEKKKKNRPLFPNGYKKKAVETPKEEIKTEEPIVKNN